MWRSHTDKTFKASHVYWHVFPVQLVLSANTKFLTDRANVRYYKNFYYKNAFMALPKTKQSKTTKVFKTIFLLKFYSNLRSFSGLFQVL